MRLLVPLLLLATLAGCTSPAAVVPQDAQEAGTPLAAGVFAAPVTLTSEGPGFEPSIDVGPDGVVYAAAAKTARPQSGGRLASWLWYSTDNGTTFRDLPSPGGAHRAMFGFEGDTAVDAAGRFYFTDTYLPDNTLHRWSPGPEGPRWDYSRPVTGTTAALDDRPWMSAHGDGVVYLLSNNAAYTPVAGDLLRGDPAGGRIQLFVSEDGGMRWSLGHGFGQGVFCQVAASPADDVTAYVACRDGEGAGVPMSVHRSQDRGATWEKVHERPFDVGTAYLAPGVAVDRAGTPYAAWLDERVDWSGFQDADWNGEEPGRVRIAWADASGAWRERDITPFTGRFGLLHAAAGSPGVVALVFYATHDLKVTDETEWRAYALLGRDAATDAGAWTLAPLVEGPVAIGRYPPRDLFQVAVGPDDAVHAVVQRDRDEPHQPGDGIRADILYVRTTG